ncbi:energy transducer TonB [Holophaga foetida]|uniref:energy transducer TonB n=1 Tax=Holophaga foetida TaxID=35839 RepID=UPI0002E73A80|nr:energy transducer TonB [Holophaga foetida]
MNTDPTKNILPQGARENLESAVYRASLAEGNASVRRASPMVTLPITLAMYLACGGAAWYLARTSKTVQTAIKKTVGIDLSEQKDLVDTPPAPPPPPPAPAPVAPPRPVEKNDAPPPPPLTNQETVPEAPPKELPKEDLGLKYAQPSSGAPGAGPTTGTPAGTQAPGGPAHGSGSGKVVDFDFNQIKIKYQPPAPPYPPIAKIARIQGTVVVQITIDTNGSPIKATAIEGPPQLRPTAENYAMQWRFEPAMLNGVPQFGRFTLTMPFRLR